MWCIKKFCCFQFLTVVILTWMIFDLTKASQVTVADTADIVADFANDTVAVAGPVDTDADDGNIQLSEQLFEFAQFFTTVNFNAIQNKTNHFNKKK